MSQSEVASAQASSRVSADVLAAGAVCWRQGPKGLEVVLIHRPKYNDWSWPKGKVDPGETLPEAAIREVKEETGFDIHLGIPLPSAQYTVGRNTLKKVFYWSAEVKDEADFAPLNAREVDTAAWFPVDKARAKLTSYSDREQLDALEKFAETDALRSWPLILVRHGKAFPRAKWYETEHVRPLLKLGTRQAMGCSKARLEPLEAVHGDADSAVGGDGQVDQEGVDAQREGDRSEPGQDRPLYREAAGKRQAHHLLHPPSGAADDLLRLRRSFSETRGRKAAKGRSVSQAR